MTKVVAALCLVAIACGGAVAPAESAPPAERKADYPTDVPSEFEGWKQWSTLAWLEIIECEQVKIEVIGCYRVPAPSCASCERARELVREGFAFDYDWSRVSESIRYSQLPPLRSAASPPSIEGAHISGPADARVTIIEYVDLASPTSRAVSIGMDVDLAAYADSVRLASYPVPRLGDPISFLAARVAEAAATQGKYWEMRRALLSLETTLTMEIAIGVAQMLGLDVEAFKAALASEEVIARVDRALEHGKVPPPRLLVNGRGYGGDLPLPRLIDRELAAQEPGTTTAAEASEGSDPE